MPNDNPGFFSFLDHFTFVEDDSSSYEIGIGDAGFSYLDMVSDKKARQITLAEKQKRDTSAALDGSTRARGQLNIRKVERIDHDAVSLDTSLDRIIRDIQDRKKRVAFFPIGVVCVALLLLGWWLLPDWMARFLVGIFLFPGAFVGLLNLWKLDVSRRHARLKYRFSGEGHAAFQGINQGMERLAGSEQVLLLTGYKYFEDMRYSGGAASLPDFKVVQLGRRAPPLIDLDSPVWHVRADRRDLYFMPDHVMIYDGANIGGVSYSKLELRSALETTQARTVAKQTRDSKVVGTTYRFVNNDGTPDQRFNNNVPIPLLEYGVFCLSGSGLDMRLFASNQNASVAASRGFEAMQRLAAKPVVTAAETRRREATVAATTPRDVFGILLDAMCCVMVSDGRMSSSEKARLQKIMSEVKAPLSPEQVSEHIATFLQRVSQDGFSSVMKSTCEDVNVFKERGKTAILVSCLQSVAAADGTIQDAERKIVDRFRAVVT